MKRVSILLIFLIMSITMINCSSNLVYDGFYDNNDSILYVSYSFDNKDYKNKDASLFINNEFVSTIPLDHYVIVHLNSGDYNIKLKVGAIESKVNVYLPAGNRTHISGDWGTYPSEHLEIIDEVKTFYYGTYSFNSKNTTKNDIDSKYAIEVQANLILKTENNNSENISFKKVIDYDIEKLPEYHLYIEEDNFEAMFIFDEDGRSLTISNITFNDEKYSDVFVLNRNNNKVDVALPTERDKEDCITYNFIMVGNYSETSLMIETSSWISLRAEIFKG